MYLVTGGSGYLGAAMVRTLSAYTDEKILAVTKNGGAFDCGAQWLCCDLGNSEGSEKLISAVKNEPLTVFWFSAFHNIDKLRDERDYGYAVNVTALERFFSAGLNIKKLFFASTDCVYGENLNAMPARESDELKPISIYGEQKARAEEAVISAGANVARLPLMFGKSQTPLKPHFYDSCKEKLVRGEQISMIDGFVRSALDYVMVSGLLFRLSKKENAPQVINVCGDKSYSKYELGLLAAKNAEADASLVMKLPISEAKRFYVEPRAQSGLMDNSLLKKTLGLESLMLDPERCL